MPPRWPPRQRCAGRCADTRESSGWVPSAAPSCLGRPSTCPTTAWPRRCSSALQKAQKSAAKAAQKAAALDLRSLEEVKQDAARNKGWRGLVAAAQQHQALLLGCAVLAAAGGYFLHQQGVFAAAAAAAQSAAAGAARLWAVAAELVG